MTVRNAPGATREGASATAMRASPASSSRAAVDEPELADRVADAARAVEGVVDLHSGTFGEVATYLPGRRVTGIRIRPEATEVHVVLRWGAAVRPTADAVRAVVRPLVGTRVDVWVEDVVDPSAAASEADGAP